MYGKQAATSLVTSGPDKSGHYERIDRREIDMYGKQMATSLAPSGPDKSGHYERIDRRQINI